MQPTPSAILGRSRLAAAFVALAGAFLAASLTPASGRAAPAAPGKQGRLTPPPSAVSLPSAATIAARLEAARRKSTAPDSLRLVALRVEFPDLAMGESPPADELHDRFWFETQFRYLQQYFDAASKGRTHVRVDVPDPVAIAEHGAEYYGDFAHYDSLMVQLLGEMIPVFDAGVDFRNYDGVILMHAGPGQESDLRGDSPLQIWSGFLDRDVFREQLSTPDSIVAGLPTDDGDHVVADVIILPEWEVQDLRLPHDPRLGHLGVWSHEVGLKLGMIPLFDSNPLPIPDSQGIGNFGIMGYGLWVANGFIPSLPCAFNRMLMGWVDPIDVEGDADVFLRDLQRGPADSVVVRVPITDTEYFLVSYMLEDPDGPMWWVCGGDTLGYQRVFAFADRNDNCSFDYEDLDGNEVLSPGDLIDDYSGAEWDFFMTDLIGLDTAGRGYGLLILHVDEQRLVESLRADTGVQSDPNRHAIDVEEADGIEDLQRGPDSPRSFGSFEDYWVGNAFDANSSPNSNGNGGGPTGLGIAIADLPDSSAVGPGGRARVRVSRGAVSADPASPSRVAAQSRPGHFGQDLLPLALPNGEALVVTGAPGILYLLDATLDEAPVSDGDPSAWVPWQSLPPELAGSWTLPPVAGDLDGDGSDELVAVAEADSAGGRRTRLFAWRNDGTEFADRDGNPMTNTGWLESYAGNARRLLLVDVHDDPGLEIVVAIEDSNESAIYVLPWRQPCSQAAQAAPAAANGFQLDATHELGGGPIAVHGSTSECATAIGLAWVEVDRATRQRRLRFRAPFDCCDSGGDALLGLESGAATEPGSHLLAGDLDADGTDEVVVVGAAGRIEIVAAPTRPGIVRRRNLDWLGDRVGAPPAVADLHGDGTLEVLVGGETALHVLSLSGAAMPGWPYRYPSESGLARPNPASPLVADLDGSGRLEILLAQPNGGLAVWGPTGRRRPHLEAALPKGEIVSPLLARLAPGSWHLVGLARSERVVEFSAEEDSVSVRASTEVAAWTCPRVDTVAWSQRGGNSSGAFRVAFDGVVQSRRNDPQLGSFAVGPNPASDQLRARVELTAAARVSCALYNLEGEIVHRDSRSGVAGEIVEFTFDLRGVASGVYLAQMRLSTGGQRVRPVAVRR